MESNSVKIIPIIATLVVVPMNANDTVRPGDNQSHNLFYFFYGNRHLIQVIFPSVQNRARCEKYLKDNKACSDISH